MIKLKNTALLGAESYLGRVIRVTFPRYFRSLFKFSPIPVLPLFSGGILDLPRTELSSAVFLNCLVLYVIGPGP